MKRLLALLLAVVMTLSLAACGKTGTGETTGSTETTQPTGATETTGAEETTDPADLPELYRKESYTGDDETVVATKDVVVATAGGAELTNAALQIYYWMDVYSFLNNYSAYLSYLGADFAAPLDEQDCGLAENGTWQHYFLDTSLNAWQNYQALALVAEDEQVPMAEEMRADLETMEQTLLDSAEKGGYESVDAMLQKDAGPGCSMEVYMGYLETYYRGSSYFNTKYAEIDITDAMVEEYFTEHESELAEGGITKDSGDVHDVRHILIAIEGGTKDEEGNVTYSDAEWAACQADAQKVLEQWLSGEATEASFAELAAKNSADTGSTANGGLYSDLNEETNFVEEFKNWYLDESRQPGDYGLVKSSYGYHIMYYSGSEAQWYRESRYYLLDEMAAKIVTDAVEKYTMEVDYDAIVLCELDLLGDESTEDTTGTEATEG